MSILVTGGQGTLGRAVLAELAERGSPGLPASRRTGVDLRTGAGVEAVVADAETIVHCATHPLRSRAVDLNGTRSMLDVLRRRGLRPHIVFISIVGVEVVRYPYYRAKRATEIALQRSGLPVTTLRATQFHTLVKAMAEAMTVGSVALVPTGLASQPCDVAWVAKRLVDVALGRAPSAYVRAADLAGPERVSVADAVVEVAQLKGRPWPRLVEVPPLGPTLRSFAAGGNLPGPDAEIGGVGFRAWLAQSPPEAPTR